MEIISGVERQRRWRAEDMLRIVAEVEAPGAYFAEVARRHDVSRGLLSARGFTAPRLRMDQRTG